MKELTNTMLNEEMMTADLEEALDEAIEETTETKEDSAPGKPVEEKVAIPMKESAYTRIMSMVLDAKRGNEKAFKHTRNTMAEYAQLAFLLDMPMEESKDYVKKALDEFGDLNGTWPIDAVLKIYKDRKFRNKMIKSKGDPKVYKELEDIMAGENEELKAKYSDLKFLLEYESPEARNWVAKALTEYGIEYKMPDIDKCVEIVRARAAALKKAEEEAAQEEAEREVSSVLEAIQKAKKGDEKFARYQPLTFLLDKTEDEQKAWITDALKEFGKNDHNDWPAFRVLKVYQKRNKATKTSIGKKVVKIFAGKKPAIDSTTAE